MLTVNQKSRPEIVKPEYFFWTALAASLFLLFGPPPIVSPTPAAATFVLGTVPQNPFESVELSAKAAFVYDLRARRKIYGKSEREVLPLASLTKIMTAATALALVPETTYVTVDAQALEEEGDNGLRAGEQWLLRDILKFMLIESSNDAAVAVAAAVGQTLGKGMGHETRAARALFVAEMNGLSHRLGFRSTAFANETGLDVDERTAGAYSTAEEAALLLAHALTQFPEVLRETRSSELTLRNQVGELRPAENTNKDTNRFPLLLASKTGYTDLAGGNLVVAFDAGFNRPIVVVVLGSTADGRFTDTERLVWAAVEFLTRNK
jgi:D-alanyl-D-alanine carboxypeptidase